MKKVFIDGETGTTGLQVRERLVNHPEIEVISIDPEKKRDVEEKRRLMKEADVTVLCLPDDAAKDTVALAQEEGCRVLDASSVHRVAEGWVYGMAELDQSQRQQIQQAQFVSNPGCYPTGIILLLKPLVEQGLLAADGHYTVNAISGYTGGGKQLIERYESDETAPTYATYGLNFKHKHLPEIQKWSQLTHTPIFIPSVGDFAQGMLISIPLTLTNGMTGEALHQVLTSTYAAESFVTVHPFNEVKDSHAPFLTPHGLENTNQVELAVFASEDGQSVVLSAKLDNLGKGASGAAVQNLNLMLGCQEDLAVEL
ncbi:N-acetyl-gamma-glutamyl-phosphate reductase [Marinomonas ostreistagni]|uniref:N-acetyl-gamma-glutamyl-phosphate reductase n=1 Tax=Marinomonas ostreistagni TaxID=359209 RepID=UPI0019512ACA|nr:N-acetyl-gamma-glutamyl-phosphate reductase [Marinomonas ostreistagni]MBM6551363.1 N-acetyl-gamma-glutamyl-phosphate reductase [Marinomonas ostreistagni]